MNRLPLLWAVVAILTIKTSFAQDPTCAAFIQQMNNDSCCPLVLEQLQGPKQILNQVNDAIPLGVDEYGDTIYLGERRLCFDSKLTLY